MTKGVVCALLQSHLNEVCLPAWQLEILFALFTFNTSNRLDGPGEERKMAGLFFLLPNEVCISRQAANMKQSGSREVFQA